MPSFLCHPREQVWAALTSIHRAALGQASFSSLSPSQRVPELSRLTDGEAACCDRTAPALLATKLCQSLTCACYLLASGCLAGQEGESAASRVESASLGP